MYSFIWFLNNIKKCYFYLNKSHLVAGEHCKSYKLKSEVFTNHTCWMHLRTREGIFARTLASHHCGWVISRTLLLMSAKIFVDPRLFSRRSSTGSPCFFFLIKLTFWIPITMRRTISWEMWNVCSLILVCFFLLHLQAEIKFFGACDYRPGNIYEERERDKRKLRNFRNFSHETLF